MFNINHTPKFTRSVTVRKPEGDGIREDTFKATFVAMTDQQLSEFNTSTLDGQKDLLRAVTKDLGDIVEDDDKTEIPFGPDLLEMVLQDGAARTAMLETFTTAVVECRLGN